MPTTSQSGGIAPPEEISSLAIQGFFTGALRFGSMSILAHMIISLPHPFKFSSNTAGPSTTSPSQWQPSSQPQASSARPSTFSREFLRSRLVYRPLEGFSEWLSPASRVYRGLTPQFKVFIQIGAMTLGGFIWAEHRVNEYIEQMRKLKRAERVQAQRMAFSGSE